jgi:hypothetical protein
MTPSSTVQFLGWQFPMYPSIAGIICISQYILQWRKCMQLQHHEMTDFLSKLHFVPVSQDSLVKKSQNTSFCYMVQPLSPPLPPVCMEVDNLYKCIFKMRTYLSLHFELHSPFCMTISRKKKSLTLFTKQSSEHV